MRSWVARLRRVGWIAHWLRAADRFGDRLGPQFAAAITYFSVLSVVPIAMVAFAVLGLTLTILVPDLLQRITAEIDAALSGAGTLGEELTGVVNQALDSWQAVGVIGLLSAGWSGARWVANLRTAVRAQTRPRFGVPHGKSPNVVVQTLVDLGILFALLLLVVFTFALSSAATAARALVRQLLRLDQVAGGDLILSAAPVLSSLVAGFVLFVFLFRALPAIRIPMPVLLRGSLIGSAGMAVLQYATGLLIGVFNNNPASAVFGNVIVVMLFLNLFAVLILVMADWMVTVEPAPEPQPSVVSVEDLPRQPTPYATKQLLAALRAAPPSGKTEEPTPAGRAAEVATGVVAVGAVTLVTRWLSRLLRARTH